MNILEMIKEGLRMARAARTLWLYGFFVGLASAASSSNGPVPGAPATSAQSLGFSGAPELLALIMVILVAAGAFMYFVSEGALIEGVRRIRATTPPDVREGWRDGLAHWGVLFRITAIYLAAGGGSLLLLAAPALLASKMSGPALAIAFLVPAALIAVPWLVTLYMWQAFASRIAVIENRHARDAIGKARLFLHGRLLHGLKLIVASVLGRIIVTLAGGVVLAAVALVDIGVLKIFGMTQQALPVIALGATTLLPIAIILMAISGTTQSSIWTIGYLMQEQQ
ncbi:MAG TPA: hypothetical protein VFR96_14150 [Povalibacter sp.]|jgi:hypothetical protein|nr:hypothetical protein [Povalibacter sp.]